jgi:hypothetical protein
MAMQSVTWSSYDWTSHANFVAAQVDLPVMAGTEEWALETSKHFSFVTYQKCMMGKQTNI